VTQFNSFYQAFLILRAVVLSTAGVLLGLLITRQPFGIVMSGVASSHSPVLSLTTSC